MKVVQFKLADFGIGSQLLLVAAVPLLAISVRLSIDGWNAWQASCNAYVVATLSKQVPNFGQFIHELQQERAKSAVFLGAGGQLFVAELKAQRSNTDKAFAELGQAFSALESHPRAGVLLAARPEVEADAAELDALRKRIDALTPSASESTVRFTAAIGRILGLLSNIPAKAENSIINRHARAYAALVEGKEIAGQE